MGRETFSDLKIRATDQFSSTLEKGKRNFDEFRKSLTRKEIVQESLKQKDAIRQLGTEIETLRDKYRQYAEQTRQGAATRQVGIEMVQTRAKILQTKDAIEQQRESLQRLRGVAGGTFREFSQRASEAASAAIRQAEAERKATAVSQKKAEIQARLNAQARSGFADWNHYIETIHRLQAAEERSARQAALKEQIQARLTSRVVSGFSAWQRQIGIYDAESAAFVRSHAALKRAEGAATQAAGAQKRLKQAVDATTASVQRQNAVESRVLPFGSAAGGRASRGKKFGGEDAGVEMYGLRPYQMVNLGYQINDVIGGVAMGQAPLQILAQQAGQFAQIWPEAMVALVRGVPILLAAGAAFSPLIAAMMRVSEQKENLRFFNQQLAVSADGGRYSAEGLSQATREMRKFGVATEDARTMLMGFVSAGIDQGQFVGLGRLAKDLAEVTGQDVPAAAEKMLTAFRGGSQGVRDLDREMNFLTASQLDQVRAMERAGNAAGAMALAQGALRDKLAATKPELTEWQKATKEMGQAWDDLVTAVEQSGLIELASKGLMLVAMSAKGWAYLARNASGAIQSTIAPNDLQRMTALTDRRNKILNDIARDDGAFAPRTAALQEELAAVEAEIESILRDQNEAYKEASDLRDQNKDASEAEKKIQSDINFELDRQIETAQREAELAALTNRERFIEQGLLEAKTRAMEAQKALGLDAVGLTEEQNRLLRERLGMAFDTQASAELMTSSGMSGLVDKIVGVESGGNASAKNPQSTATGLGQFIASTWLDMFRRYFPDRAASMSEAAILELRKESAISRKMVELYAMENAKVLQSAGVAVNEASLYLAHFLGPRGAAGVMAASASTPVSSILGADQIAANRSILEGKNAGEVRAWSQRKMGVSSAELDISREMVKLDEDRAKKAADEEEKRLKREADYMRSYAERMEGQKLELSLQTQEARQAAITKALYDEELKAKEAGLQLTKEQRDEIASLTGRQFDRENAETRVNQILERRQLLVQNLTMAREAGDAEAISKITGELDGLEGDLGKAIDDAIAFWQAIGGPQADAAILKLKTLKVDVQVMQNESQQVIRSWNEWAANQASSGISQLAQDIAAGENAIDSLGRAFAKFAADFLIKMGEMIVQANMLKILQGSGFGNIVGGFLGGLGVPVPIAHTGGVIGTDALSTKVVNPAVFSGAMRYHGGGFPGLKPNEVPTVLEMGEEVLTASDPRHRKNGGGATQVRVVNVLDPNEILDTAVSSPSGEQSLINFVTRNKRAISGILGS
ncbi:tail length tape measure protein [Gemmobacter caeni]|uniref:Tail length tape measure protein n=1 Tax=Gemmobacter caeni TaxID=589035 RepID=A0A2T6AZ26_9RHOB|nr:phage tail length tape measure family protein [Gemmobacter caeni]PTX49060.1 tail length tape measure protein [Gemmobacter caeni]TWI98939.1 tail length tape measure protein [Gemmobacter caeni]